MPFQSERKCKNGDFSEELNGHPPDGNLVCCKEIQFPILAAQSKQKVVTNFITIMVLLQFGS